MRLVNFVLYRLYPPNHAALYGVFRIPRRSLPRTLACQIFRRCAYLHPSSAAICGCVAWLEKRTQSAESLLSDSYSNFTTCTCHALPRCRLGSSGDRSNMHQEAPRLLSNAGQEQQTVRSMQSFFHAHMRQHIGVTVCVTSLERINLPRKKFEKLPANLVLLYVHEKISNGPCERVRIQPMKTSFEQCAIWRDRSHRRCKVLPVGVAKNDSPACTLSSLLALGMAQMSGPLYASGCQLYGTSHLTFSGIRCRDSEVSLAGDSYQITVKPQIGMSGTCYQLEREQCSSQISMNLVLTRRMPRRMPRRTIRSRSVVAPEEQSALLWFAN